MAEFRNSNDIFSSLFFSSFHLSFLYLSVSVSFSVGLLEWASPPALGAVGSFNEKTISLDGMLERAQIGSAWPHTQSWTNHCTASRNLINQAWICAWSSFLWWRKWESTLSKPHGSEFPKRKRNSITRVIVGRSGEVSWATKIRVTPVFTYWNPPSRWQILPPLQFC